MFKLVPLRHLKEKLQFRLRLIKIAFLSLTYNEHLSWNYVFDTLMEPAIWFLDTFSKILGPLFVSGCIILVSCVVFIGKEIFQNRLQREESCFIKDFKRLRDVHTKLVNE